MCNLTIHPPISRRAAWRTPRVNLVLWFSWAFYTDWSLARDTLSEPIRLALRAKRLALSSQRCELSEEDVS